MRRLLPAVALTMCAVLAACGGGGGGGGGDGGDDGGGDGGVDLTLETYDNGFQSFKKPVGWEVSIGGVCTTLGFVARDPDEPLRQFFFFSSLGPVYLSQAKKDFDWWATGGDMKLISYLDAPVVEPLTPANLLLHWPELSAMDAALSFLAEFPTMDEVEVVSDAPYPPLLPPGQTSLLRGVFRVGDDVGEGQFYGTTTEPLPGLGWGNLVLGATAPAGEFETLEPPLVECLESFTVSSEYIAFCVQHQQALWNAVEAQGRILRETSDRIHDGWVARTRVEDLSAYRYTDGFREQDRLYDASTGDVYLAPSGWYEANRDQFQMNDLQVLGETALPTDTLWGLYQAPTRPYGEIR